MSSVIEKVSLILDSSSRIAAASHEQNQGINQITTSVDSLNQATQETAGTAEEAASASEELSSQATALMNLVNELRHIVTGNSASGSSRDSYEPQEQRTSNVTQLVPKAARTGRATSQQTKSAAKAPMTANGSAALATNNLPSDEAWEKL